MKKSDERALIVQGKNALYNRLETELKHAEDNGASEQFIDAETAIDQYLFAIEEQSTAWPDRQDLAYACTHVLVTTSTMTKMDLELLGRLNSPSIGISMTEIAPQVAGMKTRAIAGLEKLAEAEAEISPKEVGGPPGDNDVPF